MPESDAGAEPRDIRLRRLRMRSARRGTKEMDLILGRYAEDRLASMDAQALALYERLLEENDNDLYAWVSGQSAPPAPYAAVIAELSSQPLRG
ncbi:succinate dehydrogenase assembly factor 2 [Maritimibacter sp. 55A14]|uniref:FAD assembly factor SdhE n=1 Tax=Maritimibacter sp. 55A14 TaxID=2174844 RepID=UPI000D60CBE3|nr:succinate dehydrogenase assembly factor 2 [Maritimibacter sp. 55A14]PWE34177.1 succinate dehydrogenase assembly factor 2 [Maritimibacter sp. 55A14]